LFSYLERSELLEDALINELIILAVFIGNDCVVNEYVDADLSNELTVPKSSDDKRSVVTSISGTVNFDMIGGGGNIIEAQ
jgi:hypothetical protein